MSRKIAAVLRFAAAVILLSLAATHVAASPANTDKTTCNLTPAEAALYSCQPAAGQITRTVGTPRRLRLALKSTF